MADEGNARLMYQIHHTLMEMLGDRGYMVTPAERELTFDNFKAKFGLNPSYAIELEAQGRAAGLSFSLLFRASPYFQSQAFCSSINLYFSRNGPIPIQYIRAPIARDHSQVFISSFLPTRDSYHLE